MNYTEIIYCVGSGLVGYFSTNFVLYLKQPKKKDKENKIDNEKIETLYRTNAFQNLEPFIGENQPRKNSKQERLVLEFLDLYKNFNCPSCDTLLHFITASPKTCDCKNHSFLHFHLDCARCEYK